MNVKTWLKQMKEFQSDITESILEVREEIKRDFNKGINDKPQWDLGEQSLAEHKEHIDNITKQKIGA